MQKLPKAVLGEPLLTYPRFLVPAKHFLPCIRLWLQFLALQTKKQTKKPPKPIKHNSSRNYKTMFVVVGFVLFFKTEFHCLALAVLELDL